MSDPVILLGTQSNGETLPVQVDAFGRLVAEGLQGPDGPPGPPGGAFPLPADPYEGALLGWLDGGLAWVGTPPVPIPPGVFGPITAWDPVNNLITVEGEIPAEVGTGVYLYQCDEQGVYYTEGCNTDENWSTAGTITNDWTQYGYGIDKAFDGDLNPVGPKYWAAVENTTSRYTFPSIQAGTKFEVFINVSIAPTYFSVNGQQSANVTSGVTGAWADVTDAVLASGQGGLLWIDISFYSGVAAQYIYGIRIDGKLYLDTNNSLNIRVNQLLNDQILGVPNLEVGFEPGKYLYVPQQRVAPWVLYGNDPTSLIDHLRSS